MVSTKQEDKASQEIEEILGATKPKHLGEGLTSGLGHIVRGAIGGVGCAVIMPAVSAVEGHKEMGVLGGILGAAGGVVGGAVLAANVVGGGVVTGVGQIVKGVAATPAAVVSPSQGKWWNASEGAWVTTNLLEEERWIETQAKFDEDILGDEAIPEDERPPEEEPKKKVKDTKLYDLLNLDPSVDKQMIKRRYFIMARKYSPDRAGANDKGQDEFQQIGRAYMILSNDGLREKYDRVGYARLWDDEDDIELEVNPYLLYTFLFGSEKFRDYTGQLASVTEVRVGDSRGSTVTMEQARLLQKRRVTRLALRLAERLTKWAEDGLPLVAKAEWMAEAEILSDASYGVELVRVVGKAYTLGAVAFLGSIESGVGMPSISNWARKQMQSLKMGTKDMVKNMNALAVDKDQTSLSKNVETAIDKSQGNADAEELAKQILKQSHLQTTALKILWQQTVVDITTTLQEVTQMVLHDSIVSPETRKKRGEALLALGEIFAGAKEITTPIPEQAGLEEVAFHAMLDTVWRQEMTTRKYQSVA